ncbi:MAG: tRNA epoxyqueuosine(34) reductase QueG [Acidobacteriota bacterium]
MDLEGWIHQRALELGFERVGICRAHPPSDGKWLRAWIERGSHASMGWMARTLAVRLDPEWLLAGARSVVVVALNYAAARPSPGAAPTPTRLDSAGPNSGAPLRGRVSDYARGRDYHRVIIRRLETLRRELESHRAGCRTRVCVDTSPLLERYWAQAAGIGWIGKNTNLIVERLGSWVFLGALVCDLELAVDSPAADRCGTCRRCLEACPTGAFEGPWQLDARRCISYLTIEHRGDIDPGLAPSMRDWVFGCDDCQTVCPWNRFAVPTGVADFEHGAGTSLPLAQLAHLNENEFDTLTRGRGLRRAGRDGLRRNALIALGNARSPHALGPLREALVDPNPVLRRQAARSLAGLAGSAVSTEAGAAIRSRLKMETDPETLLAMEQSLSLLETATRLNRAARSAPL